MRSVIRDFLKRCLQTPATVAIVAFYTLVIATRFRIGYWPSYGNPDAGTHDVPFDFVHLIVICLMIVTAISVPAGLLLAAVGVWKRMQPWIGYGAALVLTSILGGTLAYVDPGEFFDWFFD